MLKKTVDDLKNLQGRRVLVRCDFNVPLKDGKITDYQIVIPSTWNLAPHDPDGNYGPMEQALIGVPVADIEKPINALRTVHSFDPCTACAVHIVEPKTGKSFETVTSPWGVK